MCVQLLAEVNGTPEEATVRQRIKMRIPLLVEAIWVKVQNVTSKSRFVHVRLYLQGGARRYYCFRLGHCKGVPADETLRDRDFRAAFLSRGNSQHGARETPHSFLRDWHRSSHTCQGSRSGGAEKRSARDGLATRPVAAPAQ